METLAWVWPNPMDVVLPVSQYLPPLIADGGPDRCVHAASAGGQAQVELNASQSTHDGGSVETYRWRRWTPSEEDENPVLASGHTVTLALDVGLHPLILEAEDAEGRVSADPLVVEVADPSDLDADGVPDFDDSCLDVPDPSQCDTNLDGYGNHCDGDLNNDGVVAIPDLTGYILPAMGSSPPSNPDADLNCDDTVDEADVDLFLLQYLGTPGPSGHGCAGAIPCPPDEDGDGVADTADNCVLVANAGPLDSDGDGFRNACDGDFDQDLDVDDLDAFVFFLCHDPQYLGGCLGIGFDMDGDGTVGTVDFGPPLTLLPDPEDQALFAEQEARGTPGGSGLGCAGIAPCPAP